MSNTKQAKPKRLLSLFLALTMVLGMLPAMSLTAFAYSGSGTEGDPYIVTDYEELLELMKSTPDNTTRYIKLGSDISYSASTNGTALNLSNALQSVDLDLNGYTVSRSGLTTDTGVVDLRIGNLTIRDSSSAGTGKMTSSVSGGSGQATVYVSSGGKLTIENGTFEVTNGTYPEAIWTQGGTTQINGGTFINTKAGGSGATFELGNVTVDGGTFITSDDDPDAGFGIYVGGRANVTFHSCTAIGGPRGIITLNGTKIPEGYFYYATTIDGRSAMVVMPDDGTSKDKPIFVSNFDQLKAIHSAPTDGTPFYIALNADEAYSTETYYIYGVEVNNGQNVILDLRGHTLHVRLDQDDMITVFGGGTLTINDSVGGGALITKGPSSKLLNVIRISGAGKLTVNGGSFQNRGYGRCMSVSGENAEVILNGGEFLSTRSPAEGTYNVELQYGSMTINYAHIYDSLYNARKAGNFTINGLLFQSFGEPGVIKQATGSSCVGSKYLEDHINPTSTVTVDGEEVTNLHVSSLKGYTIEITPAAKISSVKITDVTAPVIGETVDFTATATATGAEMRNVRWFDWDENRYLSEGDVFKEGHAYMIVVTMNAMEGYAFNTTNSTMTVTVNGDDDAFVWKVQNDGKYAYIGYFFEAVAAGAAVKTVDISVSDNFTDYMTAGPDVTVTGSNFSSDLSGLWHTWNDKDLSGTNKSVAGMSYYKTITLTATGDYKFNVATAVNVTGGGKLNYNNISEDGKTMTVSVKATATEHEHDYGLAMKYNSSNHWYECSICGEKKDFGSHSLKYYSTGAGPAPGTTVTFTCHCGYSEDHTMPGTSVSEFYAVAVRPSVNMALIENSVYLKSWWAEVAEIVPGSIKWYKNDETTPLPVGYIFRSGEDYKVTVQFKAKDGYSFKDSMTGDGSGAWYEKGIDILSTYNYNTEVSADNRYVTATGYYKSTSVGVAHTVSAALPTFTPGDKFSDAKYDYNSIFTVDGEASSIGTVSVVFDDATTMVKYDVSNGEWKAYTSSGGWIDYTGTKTLDELLTIQKGVEYEIYFRDQTSSGYVDSAKSLEVADPGNSLTREVHFYSYSDSAAAAKAIYFFDSDGQSGGVRVLGTATRFGSQTDDMTIQLIKSGESEPSYEAVVKGDAAGYSIAGVLPGTYTMKVMKNNHVTREYTVIVGTNPVVQDVKIHLKGDINGDGKLTNIDVARANAHVRGTTLLSGYELKCADVVGTDGKVTNIDVAKINAHVKGTNKLW